MKHEAKQQRELWLLCGSILVCCAIMAVVDGVIQPNYAVKSAVKWVVFLFVPLMYARTMGDGSLKQMMIPSRSGLTQAVLLGVAVYVLIVGGYFVVRGFFDFSAITSTLEASMGVSKENFLAVAVYISFVNSLLEEFFFRGFAFFQVKKYAGRRMAHCFSAGAFALYHIAMMVGWFSIWVLGLAILGLFVGGLMFNLLNERHGTIYTSWLVHMCANFAINSVGLILFGIV